MRTGQAPFTPAPAKAMKVDVCVVGAGIAGLTTAYMLLLEGKSVAVLDNEPMGFGETEDATIHLTTALDHRYCELERLYGEQGSRLAAQSHTAALSCLEAIVAKENIDCDFERVDGFLLVPPDASPGLLERELAAAHRAGLTGVQSISRAPLASYDTGPCLRFPQQAQFHPEKYLGGLAQIIRQKGGRIFSGTQVARIGGGPLAWVETRAGSLVMADAVVLATNTPVYDLVAVPAKLPPSRTYVIGTRVPAGSAPRALYWDTGRPRHSVRLDRLPVGRWSEEAYDLLIVGGEEHQIGIADNADARWGRLEEWARQRFPMISGVEYRWSGEVLEPPDGLAFIGRTPTAKPNVYFTAGYSPVAGLLLADLICGRENEWAGRYDPSRSRLSASPNF